MDERRKSMKTKALRLITVVFMVTTLFSFAMDVSVLEAGSSENLTLEFTFNANDHGIVDPPETGDFTFDLVNVGGPFMLVNAVVVPVPTEEDPDYKPIFFSGFGQVVGGVFYMNLFMSQEHAAAPREVGNPTYWKFWRDSGILQVGLNLSTLEGTFWNVRVDAFATNTPDSFVIENPPDQPNPEEGVGFEPGYSAGTVTVEGKLPKCLKKLGK